MPDFRYKFVTLELTAAPNAWALGATPAAPLPIILKLPCRACSTNLSTLELAAAPKAWALATTPDYHSVDMVRLWYKFVKFRGHRSAESVGVGNDACDALAGYH